MKIKKVEILEEVVGDLEDGRAFYNIKEPGVGEYFWDSLVSDIKSLILYAGIHLKQNGLHRMLSKRFPYAIYYEISNSIAQVIAILPMRRDPAWIKTQLESRS